jgi:uncharacterized protein YdeI (YjbR/CyaY-like superfamily)
MATEKSRHQRQLGTGGKSNNASINTSVVDPLPVVAFASAKDFEQWLAANHAKLDGIWVRLYKKNSEVPSISYDEALDAALCFGWIDGQLKKHDEKSWLRKFTPRRPKSVWSKRNRGHAERLINAGRMQAAGFREVDDAKQDGRWNAAYDSARTMVIPDDFLKELAKNEQANAFFETLNRANIYSIVWRLQTAKKPETRQKRLITIVTMLANGKTFHFNGSSRDRGKR